MTSYKSEEADKEAQERRYRKFCTVNNIPLSEWQLAEQHHQDLIVRLRVAFFKLIKEQPWQHITGSADHSQVISPVEPKALCE